MAYAARSIRAYQKVDTRQLLISCVLVSKTKIQIKKSIEYFGFSLRVYSDRYQIELLRMFSVISIVQNV